ncbi:hypothetical protein N7461_005357 [Penicillium sp. DV-2018c]|nr:hypothetical protein N7461_005357 [Penicillium sp. DV-2018c]
MPDFDDLSTVEPYKRFGKPYEAPTRRVDGKPGEPHAPLHAIYSMVLGMPANEVDKLKIIISDYGDTYPHPLSIPRFCTLHQKTFSMNLSSNPPQLIYGL